MPETIGGLVFVGIIAVSAIAALIIARIQYPVLEGKCYYGADANDPYREYAACIYWYALTLAGLFIFAVVDIILDPQQFLYWLANG